MKKLTKWMVVLLLSLIAAPVGFTYIKSMPDQQSDLVRMAAKESLIENSLTAPDPTTHAIVQIFFEGLALFQFDPSFQAPRKITIRTPKDDGHANYILQGQWNLTYYQWNEVVKPSTVSKISFPNLNMPSLSLRPRTGTATDYPGSPADAEAASWIYPVSQLKPRKAFSAANTGMQIDLEYGELATCGLVHDDSNLACSIESDRSDAARAASEYAVIRYFLDLRISDEVKINVNSGGIITTYYAQARGGLKAIKYGSKSYDKVYDILISHVPGPSVRRLWTDHLVHIRDRFFDKDYNYSWNVRSPNCVWPWYRLCLNCSSNQPPCFEYLSKYQGSPSGASRPMCPFVEYP